MMAAFILSALPAAPPSPGPCDIYASAGTPCVAAHSMTRSLFANYSGPLYLVQRSSDLASDVVVVKEGLAAVASQDAFCAGTNCTVTRIFDQTERGNHLNRAPWGGASKHSERGVNAARHKLSVGGRTVYGAYFEGGMGYRCDSTWGVATGNEPETMYMVTAGRHYNGGCCFDYGNAEIDALDHGKGTMEAIYWGDSKGWSRGAGDGPWVMADIENGLWAGKDKVEASNTPITGAEFVTAMVKGGSNGFALLGGDATRSDGLKKLYEGPRPPKYQPMKKQGAIILGIGGDSSDWAVGTFYEGVVTAGYASDATDKAVHANIVAAGYGR
ncbi:hypothetical protein EMIHUDRAFT_438815 [Emiliania huxleyi CCMP1516]|uniref:Alpha-L-arabinofuranosidase B catalytic domain-containing protein n=2 Tax=Emiliania huxleyi TaxID=2903 RepID=A0A0D3I3R5_EMIH1|nr:hypothetical protein EMIHUDRAFT_438815 [Emiliania huxleyi CCMP1516]EOD05900.1 hypothetical protein EMIHUDRAFT_438815 [Emiliania huxleyi CCMP1516]|mmetsp:Transcript_27174/g.90317  ORF Transcript_27174/g.90317 Transcript_27174/m.90317 type:complete len:328 (-) Transcript_27174:188-1171(-)|eukprot:XP_005758329.1 hypothetical protein EMIHUDRAFT_438815 [Emiliania huxleyi CCMP1516]